METGGASPALSSETCGRHSRQSHLSHRFTPLQSKYLHNYKVSLLGGRGSGNMKEIQMFKDEKWVSFGEMKDARFYHDVSVIELDDSILSNCS